MVLASQFNQLHRPALVLMALPSASPGALLALFIAHQSSTLTASSADPAHGHRQEELDPAGDLPTSAEQGSGVDKALQAACPVRCGHPDDSVATMRARSRGFGLGPGRRAASPWHRRYRRVDLSPAHLFVVLASTAQSASRAERIWIFRKGARITPFSCYNVVEDGFPHHRRMSAHDVKEDTKFNGTEK